MYNSDYNISLKKKGGSQLASGGKGETIATFHAALEYLGKQDGDSPEIDKIMKGIENNFAKISTKYSKTALEKISKDKNLSPTDKKSVSEYLFENGICLPSGCNLKQEDQSLISLGITNYLKNENI